MSDDQPNQRRAMRGIMLGLTVWFAFLALGAFLFGIKQDSAGITLSPNPLRGLIVLACAVLFLGIWNLLLLKKR